MISNINPEGAGRANNPPGDIQMQDLIHSGPRLSDLRGSELTEALKARHEHHKSDWLASREPRGFFGWLAGIVKP